VKTPIPVAVVASLAIATAVGSVVTAEEPAPADFEITEVTIPMADGASLSADVYLPGDGKYPTIVTITQAPKARWRESHLPRAGFSSSGDYAVVCVNTRGRAASRKNPRREGLNPFGRDGYDVIEWVASRPWCNGKVGMWGGSNEGKNQYCTAQAKPPHLRCIMPALTTPDTKETGAPPRSYEQMYLGGVLRLEMFEGFPQGSPLVEQIRSRPLFDPSFYDRRPAGAPTLSAIEIPVMAIGAWFDNDVNRASIRTFLTLLGAANPELRGDHRLLVAPWIHNDMYSDGTHGELEYANTAAYYREKERQFFDYWLRGIDNRQDETPAISYYQMGMNEWRTSEVWPPAGSKEVAFYLHPGGGLSPVPPTKNAASVSFVSDPSNPVPTVCGQNKGKSHGKGSCDQREKVESHPDVLVFTGPVLTEDVDVAGDVKVEVHVSSDHEDTDIAFRLTDVWPDGRSMLVRDGILRMSLRESFEEYLFLTPGEVYEAVIDTIPVAHTFLEGHRIRLVVSSSNYPRWDVNTNTRDKSAEPERATNRLFVDADHASALILSVLED
jgi:predicted acyl esterase